MIWKLKEIYNELVELEEHQRIEAKLASEIGDSIMQTICAFANEPGLGGGWLLLGVSEPDDNHDTFWVKGINDVDKILSDLQNNCRNQFEQPIAIECKHEKIDNVSIIGVFVSELDPVSKPCRFTGKFHKHNKKKTGVWRRGANGDYECSEKELESILIAKMGTGLEQFIPADISLDDIDSDIIQLYRILRSKVRASAEELQTDDFNMLHALQLTKKKLNEQLPNLAGLLLFGKAISLRRLLPAIRVDYVRIQGIEWVEDPE